MRALYSLVVMKWKDKNIKWEKPDIDCTLPKAQWSKSLLQTLPKKKIQLRYLLRDKVTWAKVLSPNDDLGERGRKRRNWLTPTLTGTIQSKPVKMCLQRHIKMANHPQYNWKYKQGNCWKIISLVCLENGRTEKTNIWIPTLTHIFHDRAVKMRFN